MRANRSQLESPVCLTYKAIASTQGSSQKICALKCTSTHENWMEVFTEAKKKVSTYLCQVAGRRYGVYAKRKSQSNTEARILAT